MFHEGLFQFAGDVGGGVLDLGGQAIGMAGQAPGAIVTTGGQLISGAGEWLGGAGKWVVDDLPGQIKKMQPILEVVGQGYGVYQSYQQSRAAQEASQAYGGQVVVPYPVGVPSAGPAAQPGQFSTIVDVGMGAQAAAPMSKQETEQIIKVAAVGGLAYLILTAL